MRATRSASLLFGCLLGLILQTGPAGAGTVHADAESVVPLAAGAKVPSVQVTTVLGESVDLAKQVRERGALLVFYRGGW